MRRIRSTLFATLALVLAALLQSTDATKRSVLQQRETDNVVPSVETYGPSSERIKNLHDDRITVTIEPCVRDSQCSSLRPVCYRRAGVLQAVGTCVECARDRDCRPGKTCNKDSQSCDG